MSVEKTNLPEALKHWFASVVVTLFLPLVPLVVEKAIAGKISISSALLAASIYSISTGLVCRNVPVLVSSVVVAFFYTSLFGIVMYQTSRSMTVDVGDFYALEITGVLFIANVAIKFGYHVIDRRPFADLWLRSE